MGGNARLRIGTLTQIYVFTDARLVFVEPRCRLLDVRKDAARWQIGVVASALSVATFANATGDGVPSKERKQMPQFVATLGCFPNVVCSSEQIL